MPKTKVTSEIYDTVKDNFRWGQTFLGVVLAVKELHGVKLGFSTLKLIKKSRNFAHYCTMPKYHKNQIDKSIKISQEDQEAFVKIKKDFTILYKIIYIMIILIVMVISLNNLINFLKLQ